jgi:hypothetical protein
MDLIDWADGIVIDCFLPKADINHNELSYGLREALFITTSLPRFLEFVRNDLAISLSEKNSSLKKEKENEAVSWKIFYERDSWVLLEFGLIEKQYQRKGEETR